ncbi:MAG: aldo/keto reductase [Candidatus Delongbacteria bacterium]|nr:aldo/keto reductase [Candidatus Delongbacteria bacterium]MBN2833431.1 aldo/keto reductase [Candidatus Delongbacteria bacterium]
MKYRFLGKTGLKVSELSFGSWVTFGNQLDIDKAFSIMKTAYDSGINFFDNAEAYANGMSEEIMGQVIKKAGWKRSDLVISTKIFWGGKGPNDTGLSRKHILEGTAAALKRLQLDYVDLIFCHRPDYDTPIEETVRAMTYIVNSGRAMYWGTSEWSSEQIMEAYHIARREHLIPPVMEQPQYNMFERNKIEREYLPLYDFPGLGTTIWSPLASGLLTGKYIDAIPDGSRLTLPGYEWLRSRFETPEGIANMEKVVKLKKVSDKLGVSLTQMSLAWCLKNKNVSTVILGATTENQLIENLKSAQIVEKLNCDIMSEIELILDNKPALSQKFR